MVAFAIQVRAGDIASADDSSVAFIPSDLFVETAVRLKGAVQFDPGTSGTLSPDPPVHLA